MLRRVLWGGLVGLSILIPLGLPATARADHVVYADFHHHCYFVEFRARSCDPWGAYGPYFSKRSARLVAHDLRHHGFETRVVHR
jgi:hypothetical protein